MDRTADPGRTFVQFNDVVFPLDEAEALVLGGAACNDAAVVLGGEVCDDGALVLGGAVCDHGALVLG